jgi:choline dehydrogenase-like flavoprotein
VSLKHFNTLIVGAGSAGAVLAARLSEDRHRSVGLIEAGQDYTHIDQLPPRVRGFNRGFRMYAGPRVESHEWQFVGRATARYLEMPVPRGRVIGGSSSINGTVFLRALRQDLDNWAAAGNPDWSFERCLPYLRKLETDHDFGENEVHGAAGPIPVCRAADDDWLPPSQAFFNACTDLGHAHCPDLNLPDARGVGPIPTNFYAGLRHSSAIGYLMPIRPRPNLEIMCDTLVTHLCTVGTHVGGVEVVSGAGSQPEVITADEVILSAGAIASPHLLMLSGIGPADQLRAADINPLVDLPGVGQHLLDHPFVMTMWNTSEAVTNFPPPGVPWQLQLRTTAPSSELRDDGWLTMIMSTAHEGDDGRGFTVPSSLMYEKSQGEVRLASADPSVPPVLDFNYLSEESDLVRLRELFHLALEIGQHRAFDGLRTGLRYPTADDLSDVDGWIARTISTGHHVSCTCRMGPSSDPLAVVDQTGAVYGVENLRVIDASIFPDCPSVNLNNSVLMLAEKLADALRGIHAPD